MTRDGHALSYIIEFLIVEHDAQCVPVRSLCSRFYYHPFEHTLVLRTEVLSKVVQSPHLYAKHRVFMVMSLES